VSAEPGRTLDLALPIIGEEDVRTLRGALLAARAGDRAELERRAARHFLGYGSDTARVSMDDDVARFRRRIELLDELIAALDATGAADPPTS
jgi:hypothetical protein